MLRLLQRSSGALLVLSGLLLLPATVFAQAAITGVVKDASGGVLPGVTVEAASPVLIEKVRSVVSDDTGQYRIVDLRPGTYSVTFTLPGFSTVKREGIELTGTFVATVNGDLKVGALEETITVTGETPIVDVQSAKVQQTVSKDILAAIPSSRNAGGIQALIPGMSGNGDSGGSGGRHRADGAGSIHGGRGNDSRTYERRPQHGVGRRQRRRREHGRTWPARRKSCSAPPAAWAKRRRPAWSSTSFRATAATPSAASFIGSGANGAMQGSNYTQALKDQGLKTPSGAPEGVRRQSHGRRPDHPGQALVLPDLPRDRGRRTRSRACGSTRTPATRMPGRWTSTGAGQAFDDGSNRNGIGRITWQATPRNKINLHWSEQYNGSPQRRAAAPRRRRLKRRGRSLFQPSHIQQATWSSPVTSRVLLEAGLGTYRGPVPQPGSRGSTAPTTTG